MFNQSQLIVHAAQPCRCLCRGFLQTTRTTFFLFIILQLSQSRFTEGLTFIQIRPQGTKKRNPRRYSLRSVSLSK
jgi:hypothetical protein